MCRRYKSLRVGIWLTPVSQIQEPPRGLLSHDVADTRASARAFGRSRYRVRRYKSLCEGFWTLREAVLASVADTRASARAFDP